MIVSQTTLGEFSNPGSGTYGCCAFVVVISLAHPIYPLIRSWKKPDFKQLQKYTQDNLEKYDAYVKWIAQQDLSKLKFMDEVHFVSKSMYNSTHLTHYTSTHTTQLTNFFSFRRFSI